MRVGPFGTEYSVPSISEGKNVTAKIITTMDKEEYQKLANEIESHLEINYLPCILPLLDYYVWVDTN